MASALLWVLDLGTVDLTHESPASAEMMTAFRRWQESRRRLGLAAPPEEITVLVKAFDDALWLV